MIDKDKARFAKIFNEMLQTLSCRAEQKVGVKAYFDSFRDFQTSLPVEIVEQAGRQIKSEPHQKWMPSSGEWIALANALHHRAELQRTEQYTISNEDSPAYYCDLCSDTSWRPNTPKFDKASGLIVSSVSRCKCYAQNPVISAKRVRNFDHLRGVKG